jgi:hypothetical protein
MSELGPLWLIEPTPEERWVDNFGISTYMVGEVLVAEYLEMNWRN